MLKTFQTTALGVGGALLLAACGGQPNDAPAPAGPAPVSAPVPAFSAPASGAARAFEAPTVQAAGAAVAVTAPAAAAASLPEQVVQLRRDVADIRQQLARLPGAAHVAETPAHPRSDPAARLEAEQVEQQRIAATDTAFRSEREDPRWSRDTAAAVRAAVAEADESLRNQVRSVECRSQSCRVVISGDASGPGGQHLSSVMFRLAASLPKVTAGQVDQGDGRPATVLYLSR